MDTIKTMEEFIDKVSNDSCESFYTENKYHTSFVMQVPYGSIKLIYTCSQHSRKERIWLNIYEKAELAAIVTADHEVYFVRRYLFDLDGPESDISTLNQLASRWNDTARTEWYKQYYDSVAVPDPDNSATENARTKARYALFMDEEVPEPECPIKTMVKQEDMIEYLAGYTALRQIADEAFDEYKTQIAWQKCSYLLTKKMVEEKSVATDEELSLGHALAGVIHKGIKMVHVEFAKNGKTASGKIEADRLMRILVNRYHISTWDFDTNKNGDRIRKKLGMSSYSDELYCSDITKLTSRGKMIYEKK